jgi:DNA repair protein RecN (Recombination protein N)
MLRQLLVQNYALIDHASLSFGNGFTAITGETGSGKSILLGAFALLLGERADHKSMRDADKKCVAEAQFEISREEFSAFFSENDLDFEPLTTIRREISAGGKSRAFINDTPVSLQVLKAIGERLVDIHSQHENSILGSRSFQFAVLDAFAGHEDAVTRYANKFHTYRDYRNALDEALRIREKALQNLDYIRFQLQELDQIGLGQTDQQALEQESETLAHAGEIRSALWTADELLSGENSGAVHALLQVRQIVSKIAPHHADLKSFLDRIESLLIEARELSADISAFAGRTETDDARLDSVQSILNELYRLQQKHRTQTVGELLVLRDKLRSESETADGLDDHIAQLEKKIHVLREELLALAKDIHTGRVKAARRAEKEVSTYLAALQLPHATLQWELITQNELSESGFSDVKLLFGANKGSAVQPIRTVASGGEISRVMLALKAAISRHKNLPVLILDEIDQGVSGEVALRIGDILREMSAGMQLISITHLPQIAGKADHHFKVYKTDEAERTVTHVEPLTEEQRVDELAEMLGGKKLSQTSLEHARELLIRN